MILGVDLGTCNSLASTLSVDSTPILIPDSYSNQYITPSTAIIEGNKALVGNWANNYIDLNPSTTLIRYFKRYFGSPDPIFFDNSGNPWYSETIAALVLRKLKYDAELFGASVIDQSIITVPSHYNDSQRRSVLEAAKLAGLSTSSIIDEPVSAALSYSRNSNQNGHLILVYDFGGGTLDITVISKEGNQVNVIGKDGVPNLGGKEFDEIIQQQIASDYLRAFGEELVWDTLTINKIRKLAEGVKIELSNKPSSEFSRWIVINGRAFEFCLDYSTIERQVSQLLVQSEIAVSRCLRSCGLQMEHMDRVLLVGGTSNVPSVRNFWNEQLKVYNKAREFHDPINAVALGASIYAQSLFNANSSSFTLKTVSSYFLFASQGSPQSHSWKMLLQKNSPLPCFGKEVFYHNASNQSVLKLFLGQSLTRNDDVSIIGEIQAGPFDHTGSMSIELRIENRADGTIAMKLVHVELGKEIKFKFNRSTRDNNYDFGQQKKLIDSVMINNIA